jgi:ParB-like chromosome segregation protein Spo0J
MPDLFSREEFADYKRVDSHMLDPRSIEILPEYNGRKNLKPIDNLLREFPDPKIGQLVDVIITKREGRPVLLAGHRRWRAAIQLTEEKKGPFEGGVFKLRCKNFSGTPLECYIVTLKENQREPTDPDDDADNISRLIHNFSMSEEDIAIRVYNWRTLDGKPDVKRVRDTLALADLAPEALDALKSGKLKPTAAVALAKLSAKVQREKIASGEKLTVASINSAPAPKDTPKAPAKAKPTPHSISGMRAFWKQMEGEKTGSFKNRLAVANLAWMDSADDNAFHAAIVELEKSLKAGRATP